MLTPCTYVCASKKHVFYVLTNRPAFINKLEALSCTVTDDLESSKASGATVPSPDSMDEKIFDGETAESEKEQNQYEISTEVGLKKTISLKKVQKLYEADDKIIYIAARHDERLLAVACKSKNLRQTEVIMWDTTTWSQVQTLVLRERVIEQMEFSPNDKYLLSVDTTCSLFKENDGRYVSIAISLKKDSPHKLDMTCCSWTWDSNYFASGSNSGNVGIWSVKTKRKRNEEKNYYILLKATLDTTGKSVTALCFAPSCISEGSYVSAIGYEIGHIDIYMLNMKIVEWTKLMHFDTSEAHHLSVNKLQFQPNNNKSHKLCLASCSSDCSVKIRYIDIASVIKDSDFHTT